MNLYESITGKLKESYVTDEPVQFEAVSFEKNIPHNMRFKTFDVIVDKDKTYLYWVTQCPFNRDELEQFQKAFKDTNFDAAYVTLRDLSGYDFYRDKGKDVLATVGKNGYDANPYIRAMKDNWSDFDFDGEPYKSLAERKQEQGE